MGRDMMMNNACITLQASCCEQLASRLHIKYPTLVIKKFLPQWMVHVLSQTTVDITDPGDMIVGESLGPQYYSIRGN